MLGLQSRPQMNKIMNQTKATTAQLEATAPPLTTEKVPRAIIEMGYKDLMPFHFWLDCFEFNNLRDTYERLCAIEDARTVDFDCFRSWKPISRAEMAAMVEAQDLAMAELMDAAFARAVLEDELQNHNYLHVLPWLTGPLVNCCCGALICAICKGSTFEEQSCSN